MNDIQDTQVKPTSKYMESVANQFTHAYYYDEEHNTDRKKELASFNIFSNRSYALLN